MNEIEFDIVNYGDLRKGDIIKWYGAEVRIINVLHVKCKCGGVLKSSTYFTIEPYNKEAVDILGDFYSHATYGGIDELTVERSTIL